MSSQKPFTDYSSSSNAIVSAWNSVMAEMKTQSRKRTNGDPFANWKNLVTCSTDIISDYLNATSDDLVFIPYVEKSSVSHEIIAEFKNVRGSFKHVATHVSETDSSGHHAEYDTDGVTYFGGIDGNLEVYYLGEESPLPAPDTYDAIGYFSAMNVINWNWKKIKRD